MSAPFGFAGVSERAYTRRSMFALDVRDAVSLARVTDGLTLRAEGLRRAPLTNRSGLFVWLREDRTAFTRLTIDPGRLPYEALQIPAVDVFDRINVVELYPRPSYPFPAGTTALRGALVESAVVAGAVPVPIAAAAVRLEWLDEDGVTWRAANERFISDARGQFAAFLRLGPDDLPAVDANGGLRVRVYAKPPPRAELRDEASYPQGKVLDRTFAWDQMQP